MPKRKRHIKGRRARKPPPVVPSPFAPVMTPRAQVLEKGVFSRNIRSGETTFTGVASRSWDFTVIDGWRRTHVGQEVAGIGFLTRDLKTKEITAWVVKGDKKTIGESVVVKGHRVKVVHGRRHEGTDK